jgi:alginate O-acetyltransferase complex protein AlgI
MLFNSDLFLFAFLPLTYALFIAARAVSSSAAGLVLALASCIFYAAWQAEFLALLLASATGNYCAGRLIGSLRRKEARLGAVTLAICVATNLALLGYYKYAGFLGENVGLGHGWGSAVLPLGISFFTFTQIAYLVDVWKQPQEERDPLRYLLFVTVFPHLIAGPILHHREMIPQFGFSSGNRNLSADLLEGFTLFVLGLFKKVMIADSIAPYSALAFGPTQLNAFDAWAGALAFTLQLYFDFSGYSDMAIGLARMFGMRFPLNFDSPYKATSIVDFWRRWHITLSRFLRDYLYIPLGGSRSGAGHYANLLITMLLGGLWHGAGWTFVIWGGLHGCFLVVNHSWRKFRDSVPALRSSLPGGGIVGRMITFLCVTVAWVFFRASDMREAVGVLQSMAGASLPGGPVCEAAGLRTCFAGVPIIVWWISALLLVVNFLPNTQQIMGVWDPDPGRTERFGSERFSIRFRPSVSWALALAAMFAATIVWLRSDSPFLYYQF